MGRQLCNAVLIFLSKCGCHPFLYQLIIIGEFIFFRLLPVFLLWSPEHAFRVGLLLLQWTMLMVPIDVSNISTSQFWRGDISLWKR